jgi:acyl dehydratase
MLDRSAVGRTTPPTLTEIERGAIRRFAESLGDYNPIYFDAEYARASGFANITAPPGFPLSFAAGGDLRELLGVPSKNLVLGDITFEYERPIVAGDRLLVTSRVAEIAERPGPAGKVEVAVIEDEGRDEEGHVVFRIRRSYVVRALRETV